MLVMQPTRAEGCSCNRIGDRSWDSQEKRVLAQRLKTPTLSGLVELDDDDDALWLHSPITPQRARRRRKVASDSVSRATDDTPHDHTLIILVDLDCDYDSAKQGQSRHSVTQGEASVHTVLINHHHSPPIDEPLAIRPYVRMAITITIQYTFLKKLEKMLRLLDWAPQTRTHALSPWMWPQIGG